MKKNLYLKNNIILYLKNEGTSAVSLQQQQQLLLLLLFLVLLYWLVNKC